MTFKFPFHASAGFLLSMVSVHAQSFNVDVGNFSPNGQVNLTAPGSYTNFPSTDYNGVGWSEGFGTYYIADGFITGSTSDGPWQSFWYDANGTDPDSPPHGGSGTVDIVAPGGIPAASAGFVLANGLPSGSSDTNGQYLGIYGEPTNGNYSEYALWDTAINVASTTLFTYEYQWANAGGTLTGGTEVLIGANLGARFFVDTDQDYSNGGIAFAESSMQRAYTGAGLQTWVTESGTFTLAPGTYYWGLSATGDSSVTYITVDGISIQPIPEPSAPVMLGAAGLLLLNRRRRK